MKDRDEKKENKKNGKEEKEELTGMAAVWDYLKTFLIIFCVVFAMNNCVYQCRDSVGIYAEYDHERRPGGWEPVLAIYQR